MEHRESHRAALHGLLAEIIADARDTTDAGFLLMPAFAKFSTDDFVEFADTDSGREMGERHKRLQRNLVRIRLQVADEPLRTALTMLAEAVNNWSEKAVGETLNAKKSGAKDVDAAIAGMKHVRHTRDLTDALEQVASDLIRTPLSDPPSADKSAATWWRKLRSRQP